MNTGRILRIASTNSNDTERLGEQLGSHCRGGEIIVLVGDLGSGKTTLVRGLAKGLGCVDHVSSPTFKISNVYKAGKLELQHFDFYRLSEAGIMAVELAEVIDEPDCVTVIEWGEVVKDVLPAERVTITFSTAAESTRNIEIEFSPGLKYLVKNLLTESIVV